MKSGASFHSLRSAVQLSFLRPVRLLDHVRERVRELRYSIRSRLFSAASAASKFLPLYFPRRLYMKVRVTGVRMIRCICLSTPIFTRSGAPV